MALLEIKLFGCPTLRRKTSPVAEVSAEVKTLTDNMYETMYEAEGIGLAAPQVGVLQQVLVMDVTPQDPASTPMVLINPEILEYDGRITGEEGCLSIPGVSGDVKRAEDVCIKALDRDGQTVELTLSGIAARVAQHEIDHLDGILVTDHFSTIKRNLVRSQLRKLKREGTRQALDLVYAPPSAEPSRRSR
jgi:peptide deformylase